MASVECAANLQPASGPCGPTYCPKGILHTIFSVFCSGMLTYIFYRSCIRPVAIKRKASPKWSAPAVLRLKKEFNGGDDDLDVAQMLMTLASGNHSSAFGALVR